MTLPVLSSPSSRPPRSPRGSAGKPGSVGGDRAELLMHLVVSVTLHPEHMGPTPPGCVR